MVVLEPLTAGFDWEVGVYKPGLTTVDNAVIEAMCRSVQEAHPANLTGREWCYLEQRSGICRSFEELLDRATASLAAAHAECRQRQLRLGPVGMMPTEFHYLGAHVHVGCVHTFSERVRLANALWPYLPALIALSAHSPFAMGELGEYKSYRVGGGLWDVSPVPQHAPETAFEGVFGDLCTDRGGKPTLEVRIADSAGSARFLAEYATFLAAFVWSLVASGEADRAEPCGQDDLVLHLENRAAAARHGLQATFSWQGRDVPVADLLATMLDRSAEGLARFGVGANELSLLQAMLLKRRTQADLLLDLVREDDDPLCYVERCFQVLSNPLAFETWLVDQAPLPVLPREDPDARLWAAIGAETELTALRFALRWPSAVIERKVVELEAAGRVTCARSPLVGLTVSRV